MKRAIDVVFSSCYTNTSVSYYQKVIVVTLIVVLIIIPLFVILGL